MSILLVPTNYANLATALGAANPNDTIRAEESGSPFQGASNKNLDPAGLDPLRIEGETGDPVDIVIDCQNSGKAFYLHNGESSNVEIDGITILDGNVGAGLYGGGIEVLAAQPTVSNCIIESCYAAAGGGGLAIRGVGGTPCLLTAINCLIINNSTGVSGGGVLANAAGAIRAYNCTVTGNSANSHGGGVYSSADETDTILNDCIIYGNSAVSNADEIYAWSIGNHVILNYCNHENQVGDLKGSIVHNNCQHDQNPLFVTGVSGDYYLSQIAAGQGSDSPCVDAGSDTAANLGLDDKTTRTDHVVDEGQVDRGFHYYPLTLGSPSGEAMQQQVLSG